MLAPDTPGLDRTAQSNAVAAGRSTTCAGRSNRASAIWRQQVLRIFDAIEWHHNSLYNEYTPCLVVGIDNDAEWPCGGRHTTTNRKLGAGYPWAGQSKLNACPVRRSMPVHLTSLDRVGDLVPTGSERERDAVIEMSVHRKNKNAGNVGKCGAV